MKANGTKRKIFNDAVDLLAGTEEVSASENGIRLPADVYERYFAGVKPADVAGIVEEALAAWFGKGGQGVWGRR